MPGADDCGHGNEKDECERDSTENDEGPSVVARRRHRSLEPRLGPDLPRRSLRKEIRDGLGCDLDDGLGCDLDDRLGCDRLRDGSGCHVGDRFLDRGVQARQLGPGAHEGVVSGLPASARKSSTAWPGFPPWFRN